MGLTVQDFQVSPRLYSAIDIVKYGFLAFLSALFLIQLVASLDWPLGYDTSFMHYVAYLINEHGFVPYRDIFEVNMPGSYLFHIIIGKLFGYSERAFRVIDIIWMSSTLIVTWLVMRPAGQITALSSCFLFGNIYLGSGQDMSLQRDVIAILPVITALLISTRHYLRHSSKLTYWLLGVLFALASLIKPHMAIGFPLIIVCNALCGNGEPRPLRLTPTFIKQSAVGSVFALLGFLCTLAVPFLWIWQVGGIQSFWEIFSSFTPLYSQLSENKELMETLPRFRYAVEQYLLFGGFRNLLIGALLGIFYVGIGQSSVSAKKLTIALFSLTLLYSVYVAIGGKFWHYHWMPYIYFASLCTALSLSLLRSLSHSRTLISLLSFLTFIVISVWVVKPVNTLRHVVSQHVHAKEYVSPFIKRTSGMTEYLRENLSPADTVQPLDWGGSALYAMLRSQAVAATPYVTDFQFYLHVSNPYIQKLRKDFIEKMNQKKPAFILDVYARAKVHGIDTSYHFPELEGIIQSYYRKDYETEDFAVFKRIDLL